MTEADSLCLRAAAHRRDVLGVCPWCDGGTVQVVLCDLCHGSQRIDHGPLCAGCQQLPFGRIFPGERCTECGGTGRVNHNTRHPSTP